MQAWPPSTIRLFCLYHSWSDHFRKKRQLIIFDENAKCLIGKLFSAEYEWSSIAAAALRDSSSGGLCGLDGVIRSKCLLDEHLFGS